MVFCDQVLTWCFLGSLRCRMYQSIFKWLDTTTLVYYLHLFFFCFGLLHLDCFYPLTITNGISINIFVQDCVDLSFSFSWVYTSNGISGLGCNCMANHLKSCHASPSYVPSSDGGSSFSTSTPTSHLTFVSIYVRCHMVSGVLIFISLLANDVLSVFH